MLRKGGEALGDMDCVLRLYEILIRRHNEGKSTKDKICAKAGPYASSPFVLCPWKEKSGG